MEECYFATYSSIGVFHVFQIVEMVPNRAKNLIWLEVTNFLWMLHEKYG